MLLTARYVVPVSQPCIENGGVLVRDGKIVAVGYATQLKVKYPKEELLDFGLAALLPGLVDCHTHLEYSAMRGLVNDVPYSAWKTAVAEKEPLFTSQNWDDSAIMGGLEAIASGITTIADITRTGASGHAAQALGLRGIIYREVEAMDHHFIDAAMEEAVADIDAWNRTVDRDRLSIGIAPASVQSCNPKIFELVGEYAKDGTPVAVHLAGSSEEYDFVKAGSSPFSVHNQELGAGFGVDMPPWLPTNVSPVRYLLNWKIFDVPNVLAIHCVHVDDFDIRKLAERGVSIAYCPRCNAKLSMGIAPVNEFLRAGIKVGLGTDSPASNDSTDMLEEMRLGLLLQRAVGDRRSFLDATSMVYMATLGAAKALHLDESIGSLDEGKEADIVAVDLSKSNRIPTRHPEEAIVYSGSREGVLMTMIGGRILYDGDFCTEVDVERVRNKVEEMRFKFRN